MYTYRILSLWGRIMSRPNRLGQSARHGPRGTGDVQQTQRDSDQGRPLLWHG